MNTNKHASTSRFEAFKHLIYAIFGVNEVLFLAGFFAFFYGISGILSIFWAFALCGIVLMVIAVGGIIFASRKGEE